MKFVAFAALIASASAADAAAKVCDADPIEGTGYTEETGNNAEGNTDKVTANTKLIADTNNALKPYLDKCAAVPTGFT